MTTLMKREPSDRRDFLKKLAVGGCFLGTQQFLGSQESFAKSAAADDAGPHFFIQIFAQGGLDQSCWLDARPLEMTANQLIHNPFKVEPVKLMGKNGQSALVTSAFDPLKEYFDYFSILNGVVMDPSNDGHSENERVLFSGYPQGDDAFLPQFNSHNSPLDALAFGAMDVQFANMSRSAFLTVGSLKTVSTSFNGNDVFDSNPALSKFVNSRFASSSLKPGLFGSASLKLGKAWPESFKIKSQLKTITVPEGASEEDISTLMDVIFQIFKSKVTRSVLVCLPRDFDTHASFESTDLPNRVTKLSTSLATVFSKLKGTSFSQTESFLDRTTVICGTEFGRTMRNGIDEVAISGTDHNPLTNSYIIGGKGISGGQIIGQSDFQTSAELLSTLHNRLDPKKLKSMGRPFDFSTGQAVSYDVQDFDKSKFLTAGSLINTLYALNKLPASRYIKSTPSSSNGPLPVLKNLLSV